MKFLWVDRGNDPDWAKVTKHGITGLYFALTDPRVTKAYLQDIVTRGFIPGVYVASTHDPNSEWAEFGVAGREFADKVWAKVKPLIISSSKPKVQLDMEEHDPDGILKALGRWRELSPNQDTSWTMEAGQAGWMDDLFVTMVKKYKVRVVPQCYNGAMTEVWDTWAYCMELVNRGFSPGIVTPFYDAAKLPHGWDGFAFTMGRLP